MNKHTLEIISFLVFFAAVTCLVFLVFKPFFYILVLATVLSVLFHPLYQKLKAFVHERNTAALLIVLLVLVCIIIPILFLGVRIFQDTQNFFSLSDKSQIQYIHTLQTSIEKPIQKIFPQFSFDLNSTILTIGTFLKNNIGGLVSQTAYLLFQTFFLLFALFFFIRDGEQLFEEIMSLSPFQEEHAREISTAIYKTINSIIKGTFLVWIIRWLLLLLVFYIFGVPNVLLWATLAAIIGAIPGLGTLFSFIPAVAYFFFKGNIAQAIGLASSGILAIFLIDNLLTTYLFGKSFNVSPIFVLFSILGGIIFFGPLGFIFGPLILSLFVATIKIYKVLLLKNSSEDIV